MELLLKFWRNMIARDRASCRAHPARRLEVFRSRSFGRRLAKKPIRQQRERKILL